MWMALLLAGMDVCYIVILALNLTSDPTGGGMNAIGGGMPIGGMAPPVGSGMDSVTPILGMPGTGHQPNG